MRAFRRSIAPLLAALLLAAGAPPAGERAAPAPSPDRPEREEDRRRMVELLRSRDIDDTRVLEAMGAVPRHRFVPSELRPHAYEDRPLPIGRGQTISQPYVVALTAQALRLRGDERILEVGSGSGYAAAVLSLLGAEVHGIELEPELCQRSLATLRELRWRNVHVRCGDGFGGWPEKAPFDAIVVSAATDRVPAPLWEQLAEGGRLVYPKGRPQGVQSLVRVTKTGGAAREEDLGAVRFVPLRRGAPATGRGG